MLGLNLRLSLSSTYGAAVGDTTPPEITNASNETQDGEGNVPVSFDLSENATVFFVLVPTGSTAPNTDEVEAGTASGGGAASDSGSFSATAGSGVTQDIPLVDGLSGNYDLYLLPKDAAGNTPAAVDVLTNININTTVGLTDPSDLSETVFWWDLTDTSTLWQNTAGTIAATSISDPVLRIDDKSGNGNHFIASSGNGIVVAGGVNMNNARFVPSAALTGTTATMEAYGLFEADADNTWMILGENGNNSFAAGNAQNGSGASPDGGAVVGTITHTIENVDQVSPTRQTLYDAFTAAGPGFVTQGLRGIDLTGLTTTLMPLAYNVIGAFCLNATARHFVLGTSLTTQKRADLHTYFDGEK